MADPKRYEELGRVLRDEADASVEPAALQRARRRFLDRPRGRSTKRRRGPLLAVAAIAVAAVLVVLWWPRTPTTPLAFEVGLPPRVGVVGEWLAAPEDAQVPVTFSEGSALTLEPQGRARVREVQSDGAKVVLERGTLRAEVAPTTAGQPSWMFEAGPFSVAVKGTAFTTSWDPASDTFSIAMDEGRVVVDGPVLQTPRELVGGDRLVVSVPTGRVELSRGEAGESESTEAAAEERVAGADDEEADEVAPAPSVSSSAAPGAMSWRDHVRDGKYGAAMELLDDGRFGALVSSGSQADLFVLADAARFGGRPDRAKAALVAARKRFGSSRAAFLLGKIAADQLRSPGEARQWFQIYVSEAPSGALAEQAWGRLLELSRGGDPERVSELAKQYLARFPNGGHAPLARKLVTP